MFCITRRNKSFEVKEWANVDLEHRGRKIEWDAFKYRFVATVKGNMFGLILGKYEAGTTYIDNIIVSNNYRKLGIGTELIILKGGQLRITDIKFGW